MHDRERERERERERDVIEAYDVRNAHINEVISLRVPLPIRNKTISGRYYQ